MTTEKAPAKPPAKAPLNDVTQKAPVEPEDKPMSKQKALDMLVDLTNADKVMNSKTFTKGSELLKISYAAGKYPYSEKMKTKKYEKEKLLLQTELLKVQLWLKKENKKVVSILPVRGRCHR